MIDGTFSARNLRDGFAIHTVDAATRYAFQESSVRQGGVVLHCILEGRADATLSGEPMDLQRRKGERVKMVVTALPEPEEFVRSAQKGEYVRKLNIVLSYDWIAANGLDLPRVPKRQKRLRHEWDLSASDVQLAERLVAIGQSNNGLHRLETESGALSLACRAFENLADPTMFRSGLRDHELRRLRRMEDYIENGQGPMPSLDQIAQQGGVSASTMRRIFHETHGCTVHDFVRQTRLHRAKHALEIEGASISEAAAVAGYGSPENFATAFRKYIGVKPSDVRRKIYQ